MTAEELNNSNSILLNLAEEWGKSPECARRSLEQAYQSFLSAAEAGERMQIMSVIPRQDPTAEEIIYYLREEFSRSADMMRLSVQELGKARAAIQMIADREGKAVAEVISAMQEVIDEAWANPSARAEQQKLFPRGKPFVEEFIITVWKQIF